MPYSNIFRSLVSASLTRPSERGRITLWLNYSTAFPSRTIKLIGFRVKLLIVSLLQDAWASFENYPVRYSYNKTFSGYTIIPRSMSLILIHRKRVFRIINYYIYQSNMARNGGPIKNSVFIVRLLEVIRISFVLGVAKRKYE